MLVLAWPAALVALAGLPVLVWAHRRGRRATPHRVSSLILWRRVLARLDRGGAAQRERPKLLELVLDCTLLAALALGAAGPRVATTIARPRAIAIVLDDSVAMRMRLAGGARAWDLAVDEARGLLGDLTSDDRALVRGASGAGPTVWLGPGAAASALGGLAPDAAPAPLASLVLALLALPERPVVHVLARRPPTLVAERYVPMPIGDPASDNVGWTFVHGEAIPGRAGVHAITARLATASATPRVVRVATPAGELERTVPARGSIAIDLVVGDGSPAPERIELAATGGDNLPDDDTLVLERAAPARVALVAGGAPAETVEAFERLFDALPGIERADASVAAVVIELGESGPPHPLAQRTYRVRCAAAPIAPDAPATRFLVLASDPRLDALDLTGVRVVGVAGEEPTDADARVLARAADGRALIVDYPRAKRTEIAFDPLEWSRDASFPVFWREAIEQAARGHGRYHAQPAPHGLAVTDNAGAERAAPRTDVPRDAEETRVERDLAPWCAGVAFAALAALAALRCPTRRVP